MEGDQLQNPSSLMAIRCARTCQRTPSEAIELAASNLSPEVIDANVIGEVNSPGRLQLQSNTPLVQAVLAAGG